MSRSAFSFTAGLVVGGSVVGYAAWLVVDGTLKQAELLALTLNILVGVPPPAYLEKRHVVAPSGGGSDNEERGATAPTPAPPSLAAALRRNETNLPHMLDVAEQILRDEGLFDVYEDVLREDMEAAVNDRD